MWDDQIVLDEYERVDGDALELGDLRARLLEKRADRVALLDIARGAMPGAVKVGEDDLDPLELDILLIRQPTLPQRLPQLPLGLLALAVGQERRVGRWVLAELDAFRGRLGR